MVNVPDFVIHIIKNTWVPGKKLLDIGCGPAYLRAIFGKDYIGTDITNEPYNANLPRDVDIICSSDNLLLSDASIDIVIIKSAFFIFPNHEKTLKECLRVLRPGGKIIIFDYNKRTQKILQMKEGHTNYPCWTQWALKKLIQKNGFTNVQLCIADNNQPMGIKKHYKLIKQELKGDWAIVYGTKV